MALPLAPVPVAPSSQGFLQMTPDSRFNFTLSITAPNEVRIVDNFSKEARQKIVSSKVGLNDTEKYWTFNELEKIGVLLHNSVEFKTEAFKAHEHLVTYLGKRLSYTSQKREELVRPLLLLMQAWHRLCANDSQCLAPPSLKTLGDAQQLKVLIVHDKLQEIIYAQRMALIEGKLREGLTLTDEEQKAYQEHSQQVLARSS